eukprot:1982423-Alexandrium_andersonii.AAC.1
MQILSTQPETHVVGARVCRARGCAAHRSTCAEHGAGSKAATELPGALSTLFRASPGLSRQLPLPTTTRLLR